MPGRRKGLGRSASWRPGCRPALHGGGGIVCALVLPDVLRLVIRNAEYHGAAEVIPVIVLAYLFQGFFLLASVGISISKEARYYPMITAAAAGLNIGLNLWLMPGYGILAAAWATVAGYALMAAMGASISRRLYPIPVQWRRVAGALAAALVCFVAGAFFGPDAAGAAMRVGLALAFSAFTWRWVLDETDRAEVRKALSF